LAEVYALLSAILVAVLLRITNIDYECDKINSKIEARNLLSFIMNTGERNGKSSILLSYGITLRKLWIWEW